MTPSSDTNSDTMSFRTTAPSSSISVCWMFDARDGDIGVDELQLAARNSGMPLEALDWPITPLGLHYLLIHYDIPRVDPASWSLEVGGHVRRPLTLSLDDLRSRPARTIPVTME